MLGDPSDYAYQFEVSKTYTTPAAITSLTLGHPFHLYAGSQDGSLRVYDLSTQKVIRAIRSLEGEVSSVICMKKPGSEFRDAWIAHGPKVSKFRLDSPKMIQTLEDTLKTVEIGEHSEDAVNELSLHYNKTHLGMGTDLGNIVILDLESYEISNMKTKHSNICGSVQFIADRGRDIASAGFDQVFLHHDFVSGELVSQATIPERPTTDNNASMSPPFITSFAISSTGVVAAGTACGLLWIGIGGEKRPDQKKTKKWQGLDPNECAAVAAAQGPIASISFSEPRVFTTSTMLGILTQWEILYSEEDRQILLKMLWQGQTQNMAKVNKVIADDKRIIVGGLTKQGKGVIEIWNKHPNPPKGNEAVELAAT